MTFRATYQGSAPGMGEINRYFSTRETAEMWLRQVGVFDRATITDVDKEDRIRAAAPDLLAALEFAYQELETAHRFKVGLINPEALGDARDAIAKARGE